MSAELITAALLNVAGVTNLVGDRRALAVLPQNCAMPALVYSTVSTTPILTMNALWGPQLLESRVQVTALALTPAGVEQILAAVMAAMNLKSGTYAGKSVARIVRDIKPPIARDNEANVWHGSQDFMAHWYE
jgi:branched-subunit amino acid transport protein